MGELRLDISGLHVETVTFKGTLCRLKAACVNYVVYTKVKMKVLLFVNVNYMSTLQRACSETLKNDMMILNYKIIRKHWYFIT